MTNPSQNHDFFPAAWELAGDSLAERLAKTRRAVLRAKVDKNAVPFEEFYEIVFGKLLASVANPMRNQL